MNQKKQYIGKAIEILKQEGFRLSLDDMATKMGITKKTLYNNFSSKDELLKECVQAISEDFKTALKDLENPNISAKESVIRCFNQLDDLFTELNPIFSPTSCKATPTKRYSGTLWAPIYSGRKWPLTSSKGSKKGFIAQISIFLSSASICPTPYLDYTSTPSPVVASPIRENTLPTL